MTSPDVAGDLDVDGPSAPDAGIYGLDCTEDDAQVVLIPVPFEATTSYGGGASSGPAAIAAASHQLDLYDVETGRPYEAGIVMLDADPRVVAWNDSATARARAVINQDEGADVEAMCAFVNGISEELEQWLYAETLQRLQADKLVGVVGGDHSVPLGALRAIANHVGPFGVLHIDAHADLRSAYQGFVQSHASIMHNVLDRVPEVTQLTQLAVRDLCDAERRRIDDDPRVRTWFDSTLARHRLGGTLLGTFGEIVETLPEQVYVSFDIDGLDPKLCPNTGTPVPGGVDLNEVSILLDRLVSSGRRIVGFDLCEVAPGDDEWDGNVGARALYKLIGWALVSRADGVRSTHADHP